MKKLILFMMVFCATNSFAQKSTIKNNGITIGYFGETVTHNGFTIGLEHYVFNSGKYQMVLAGNVGAYTHTRNNTAVFVRGQLGQRINFNSGIFFDHYLGLGYLRQFTHGGDHLQVLPNGSVVEVPNKGQSLIMPSIALGTGYNFSSNFSLYVRPELFWKAPFNNYYLTNFALNTGLIFKF